MIRNVLSKFGVCPKCMRQAFLAAFALGALSLAAVALNAPIAVVACLLALTLGGALLWVTHVVMLSVRLVRQSVSSDDTPDLARRAFIPEFARVFGAVALLTAAPGMAAAQEGCPTCAQMNCRCGCCAIWSQDGRCRSYCLPESCCRPGSGCACPA